MEWLAAKGQPLQAIARQFQTSYGSLARHWKHHVDEKWKRRAASEPAQAIDEVLEKIASGEARALDLLAMALNGWAQRYALADQTNALSELERATVQLRPLIRLALEVNRDLMPSMRATINNTLMFGDRTALEAPDTTGARQKLLDELDKMQVRLAGRNRGQDPSLLDLVPAEAAADD
jgi:hypothetical protein